MTHLLNENTLLSIKGLVELSHHLLSFMVVLEHLLIYFALSLQDIVLNKTQLLIAFPELLECDSYYLISSFLFMYHHIMFQIYNDV